MSSSRTNLDDTNPLARAQAQQQRGQWIDQAIRESQERGEFNNLAGAGKPQEFTENPHGADWESGFRMLKNAGMAPYWIEVDKDIRKLREQMTALTVRTAAFIAAHRASAAPQQTEPLSPRSPNWREKLARLWDTKRSRNEEHQPSPWDLEAFRQRARREYLQIATDLDRNIVEYNGSLPDGLSWKERQRLPLAQAEQDFDAAVPAELKTGSG